jgi:hypothetical protein
MTEARVIKVIIMYYLFIQTRGIANSKAPNGARSDPNLAPTVRPGETSFNPDPTTFTTSTD